MNGHYELASMKEALNGASKTKLITPYTLRLVAKAIASETSGVPGVGLQFYWDGTSLGVKREDEDNYTFRELKGATGAKGDTGATGAKGDTGDPGIVAQPNQPLDTRLIWLDTDEYTEGYSRATEAEARAGISNQNYMTPLRVAQAIDSLADVDIPPGLISTEGSPSTTSKVWVGTQAQYDAIGSKDATTLYFIK